MEVCAIILARSGSKGLKDKNIIKMADKPLIQYTIDAALESKSVNRTIVSTDSKKIAEIAISLGAESPFLRPLSISDDDATSESALKYTVEWLNANENYHPDIIVYLQITYLFRTVEMIDDCVNALVQDEKLDSAFMGHITHKNFWMENDGNFSPLNPLFNNHDPRQVKRPVYREDTGIALATKAEVIKSGKRIGKNVKIIPYESDTNFVDIHSKFDLSLSELLVTHLNKKPNKEI